MAFIGTGVSLSITQEGRLPQFNSYSEAASLSEASSLSEATSLSAPASLSVEVLIIEPP